MRGAGVPPPVPTFPRLPVSQGYRHFAYSPSPEPGRRHDPHPPPRPRRPQRPPPPPPGGGAPPHHARRREPPRLRPPPGHPRPHRREDRARGREPLPPHPAAGGRPARGRGGGAQGGAGRAPDLLPPDDVRPEGSRRRARTAPVPGAAGGAPGDHRPGPGLVTVPGERLYRRPLPPYPGRFRRRYG